MPTIAQLNIRLGLLSKEFERSLSSFESRMQATATRMGAIGEQMSLAITAPLLGIGVAAIKVAGDFESIRLGMTATMNSVGRGAFEAAKEIEALRISALAPGLDFEQAVKGSVRLQGVGLSAEKARLILEQLGNALASSGGNAEQLDAVTKQFTQIIGKGRILQEDLTIILENMPVLASVLREEFGTTSAEAIRNLGVTAEEFIDRITNRMATLPRVTGGITNSIVNAGVAIKQALATVGDTLNRVFNVSGNLDAFSTWITDLADRFAALDEGTQELVAGIAVFIVTLGPAIKLMSLVTSGATTLVATFARVAESFRITAAAGTGTLGLFSRLSAAAKLSIFIGASAAVLALAAAFSALTLAGDEASESQRLFGEAQQEVNVEVGKETAILNKNFEVLKNAASTTEQRTAAISELQKTYPNYLRNVDLEKASLVQLTEIQGQLNSEILRSVAERQKAIAVESQYSKVAEAQLRITQLQKQGFDALTGDEVKRAGRSIFGTDFEKSFVSDAARARVVQDVIKALQGDIQGAQKNAKELAEQFDETFQIGTRAANRQYDALTNQRQALIDAQDKLEDMTAGERAALEFSQKWDAAWSRNRDSVRRTSDEAGRMSDAYRKALASIAAVSGKGDVLGANVLSEQAKEIESQIERLLEAGFKPASREVGHLRSMLVGLRKDAEEGFSFQNATQSALGELDKLNRAISTVVGNAKNLVELSPGVDLAPIELPKIELPTGLSSTAEIGIEVKGKEEIDALREAVNKFVSDSKGVVTTGEIITETMRQFQEGSIVATQALEQLSEKFYENNEAVKYWHEQAASAISLFGDSIASALEEGTLSFQTFAQAIIGASAKVLGAIIKQFVATLLLKTAIFSKNPLVALALAGAVGSIATGLFKKVVGAAALAKGGVIEEPTLALIGEYPGAKSNPEIVTPENKMREVFEGVLSRFQPVTNFSLPAADLTVLSPNYTMPASMIEANVALNLDGQFILRGDDLLLLVDKAAARRGRRS